MIELYFNTDKLVKINGSDGLYNVSVYSDSLRLGDLELSEVGYTNSKMSHLWNAYINNDKLKIFRDTIKDSLKNKSNFSHSFIFNENSHALFLVL